MASSSGASRRATARRRGVCARARRAQPVRALPCAGALSASSAATRLPETEARAGARLHGERHVLQRREARQHVVIWNERASPSCARAGIGSAVTSRPSNAMLPGVGRERAGDLVDQRGLAGAVRPDHGVRLAGRMSRVTSSVTLRAPNVLASFPGAARDRSSPPPAHEGPGDAPVDEQHQRHERFAERHLPSLPAGGDARQPSIASGTPCRRSCRPIATAALSDSLTMRALALRSRASRRPRSSRATAQLAPAASARCAGDAAPGEQHDQHQQRPQDHLPVLGEAGQPFLEQQERGRADDRRRRACRCRREAPS